MICKWCKMESATPDRCSWCNGVLEAEPEKPADAAQDTIEDTAAGSETNKTAPAKFHAPAPPIPVAGFNRMPAPPVPPRSHSSAEKAVPLAPLTAEATESRPMPPAASLLSFQEQHTIDIASAPVPADVAPPPPADPTLAMRSAPLEKQEEFGLAAGYAKPVERPSAETLDLDALKAAVPTAQMSKYYAGKTVEETTGIGMGDSTAPRAAPPRPAKTEPEFDALEIPAATLWMRFAGAMLGVLLVAGILAYALRPNMLLPVILANFAGGMLLPLMRVAPWQDEDSDDAIFLFLLTLIFGPLVSLIIYGVIGMIKQMANPAVWGCFLVGALTRIVVEIASGQPVLQPLTPLQLHPFNFIALVTQWGSLFGLAGWFVANTFHKLHE